MSSIASNASIDGSTVTGSGVITSPMISSGPWPAASTRRRRSRSVRMPVSFPSSMMSSEETLRSLISWAPSPIVAPEPMWTGSPAMRSATRVRSASVDAELRRSEATARMRAFSPP